jgi:hypothetical protein
MRRVRVPRRADRTRLTAGGRPVGELRPDGVGQLG